MAKAKSSEPTSERVIGKTQFVALVNELYQKGQRVKSITGEMGERVKHAEENAHLNKKALSMIRALHKMDEEKRDDVLRSFDLYRTYAEEAGLFGNNHCGDLVDQAEVGTDEDPGEKQAADNAVRLEAGIKKLSDNELKEFDDSTSSKPSRRKHKEPTLEGADEPGSYKLQ